MILIAEATTHSRRVVATAPDFIAAKAKARELFAVAFLDDDEDFTDCADFITEQGTVYSIQPEGFAL